MLDELDLQILQLLKENARLQWKEIGAKIHMTGQAVAARIRRMEEQGVIRGYTAAIDPARCGQPLMAFITVIMKSNDHFTFLKFLEGRKEVVEAHRISGEGCYWLKACVSSQEVLGKLLDELLKYGNYSLSLSIGEIKM